MNRLHTLPPTEQIYRSHVPPQYDSFPVEKYFATRFSYQDEEEWSRQVRAGKIIETFGFWCSFFSNLSKNGESWNVLIIDFIKTIHVSDTPTKIAASM